LEKGIQVCLDVKGDQFQHRLWAGPVLHRSRYVYINFQVIISIKLFFIDNSLGPLARDSPCITKHIVHVERKTGTRSFNHCCRGKATCITYCGCESVALGIQHAKRMLPVVFPLWSLELWGHTVAQLVETLHYKLEGREFDSRWCYCNFSLT